MSERKCLCVFVRLTDAALLKRLRPHRDVLLLRALPHVVNSPELQHILSVSPQTPQHEVHGILGRLHPQIHQLAVRRLLSLLVANDHLGDGVTLGDGPAQDG